MEWRTGEAVRSAPSGARPPAGPGTYARIYAVVKKIPRGRVATYGQVARLAGLPGHARQVGYAMAALQAGVRVPWHRVINAQGKVSPRRAGPGAGVRQRQLLEREGVVFSPSGVVSLADFGWNPPRAARR
ncbi:MAG TPA: methylated-DNA--[protein]-cysteine S-methyltransferase [Gemmatimonadaceae bacterium]|nr:methylated-DNA--[protein]-cysteine S-methyltransferase [Gemmatimonadaceae bacterium]